MTNTHPALTAYQKAYPQLGFVGHLVVQCLDLRPERHQPEYFAGGKLSLKKLLMICALRPLGGVAKEAR